MKTYKHLLLKSSECIDNLVTLIDESQVRETCRVGLLPDSWIIVLSKEEDDDEHPFSIYFGDMVGFKYDKLEEAQHDFALLFEELKKKPIAVEFYDYTKDIKKNNTVHNLGKNKGVLVELVYSELTRQYESGDHRAIVELLSFVPNENLIGFLSEDIKDKLS